MTIRIDPPSRLRSTAGSPAALCLLLIVFGSVLAANVLDGHGLAISIALNVGLIFALIIAMRRKELQRIAVERNRFAQQLINAIRSKEPIETPFSLYLRPFFTDGLLIADGQPNLGDRLASPLEIAEMGFPRDVERAAAFALQDTAPLVAIGNRERGLGAGRGSVSDDEWRDIVLQLAIAAERILIIPLAQPSTLWEISEIASRPELLEKTILVRPPNRFRFRRFGYTPNPELRTLGAVWNDSRSRLRELLPTMPSFKGGTRLLAWNSKGELRAARGDAISSTSHAGGMLPLLVNGRWESGTLIGYVYWAGVAAAFASVPVYVPTEAKSLAESTWDLATTFEEWFYPFWPLGCLWIANLIRFDSRPSFAFRWALIASVLICLIQALDFYILGDKRISWLWLDLNRLSLAIGTSFFVVMLFGRQWASPMIVAIPLSYLLAVVYSLLCEVAIGHDWYSYWNAHTYLELSVSMGTITGAASWWFLRTGKAAMVGAAVGFAFHLLGFLIAAGFAMAVEDFVQRGYEQSAAFGINCLRMGIALSSFIALRRLGFFPKALQWQSPLQKSRSEAGSLLKSPRH